MAIYVTKHRLVPDIIICSSARRIRETLGMVRDDLGRNIPTRVDGTLYMANAADLLRQVHHLDDGFAAASRSPEPRYNASSRRRDPQDLRLSRRPRLSIQSERRRRFPNLSPRSPPASNTR
jgi:hypothetical protein